MAALEGGSGVGARVAKLTEAINDRLGLPSGVREMGYEKNDLKAVTDDAFECYCNMTAPVRPTREEFRQIVVDVLG